MAKVKGNEQKRLAKAAPDLVNFGYGRQHIVVRQHIAVDWCDQSYKTHKW